MLRNQFKKISLITIFSIIILIISYLYRQTLNEIESKRLETTLTSLLEIENSIDINVDTRIAIGYGACHDYFISARSILIDKFEPPLNALHHRVINTYDELVQVFSYYFQHGAAAERYISNTSLFTDLIRSIDVEHTTKTIGGNAPIMASRLAKEGIENILLGAQMSNKLRDYLPSTINVSGPLTELDEVHLLIEYPAHEEWPSTITTHKLIAPRANRFIVHNDLSNSLLLSLEKFHEKVIEMKPDIFIIGGLQMMDNYPDEHNEREQRLTKMSEFLRDLKSSTNKDLRIHFEMASFSDEKLLKTIGDKLLPLVDSIGMNEQELPNLYHILMSDNLVEVANAYPRVATVLDEMRDLYKLLRTRSERSSSNLSRIHVHTLAFQAILVKRESNWKNTRGGAGKAALTAHRHTCGSHEIDKAKTKLIMDDSFTTTRNENGHLKRQRIAFNETSPIPCWNERIIINDQTELVEICVAPVLVCTKVLQTGGGGDNVSAAGLAAQL